MAATLAIASMAAAAKPAANSAGPAAPQGADGDSFAGTLESQAAPKSGADGTTTKPQQATQAADDTPGATPRARTPVELGDGTSPQPDAAAADEALDASGVETLLGLCEAPPCATVADAAAASPILADTAPPATDGTLACMPMLQSNLQSGPEPQGAQGNGRADGGDRALALLGTAATIDASQGAQAQAGLATRLEALLDDADDGGSTRDAASSPATPSLLDTRAPVRHADAAAATARAPELRAPLGTPAWTDELGSQVTWMVEQGEQVASLRLSPENLGPLDVRIAVREGETTVWFGAVHPETRAALEQSLPRLREMLGASGLALANAGVFSQTPRDPQRGFTAAALARASVEGGAEGGMTTVSGVTHRGLVDLYA